MSTLIHAASITSGKHWSMIVRRQTRLRLTDADGGANVAMLFYNPQNLTERYNAPDTLKCQHTFRLTSGHCLYSDMGRIFCSVTEDSHGWHDTVCGNSTKASIARRYGEASYQTHRNDRHQNGLDSFLVEAAKYGMKRRDLAANVNWFSKVAVDETGVLSFDPVAARPGSSVELRFEMDTLVLFHTCPHPLDPSPAYPKKTIQFELFEGPAAGADDLCRLSAGENGRGFENNRIFHACSCH